MWRGKYIVRCIALTVHSWATIRRYIFPRRKHGRRPTCDALPSGLPGADKDDMQSEASTTTSLSRQKRDALDIFSEYVSERGTKVLDTAELDTTDQGVDEGQPGIHSLSHCIDRCVLENLPRLLPNTRDRANHLLMSIAVRPPVGLGRSIGMGILHSIW